MTDDCPLLDFDPAPAVIEPSQWLEPHDGMPEHCVLCMHGRTWRALPQREGLEHLFDLSSTMGPHPVYRLAVGGRAVALAHPGLGAPLAVGLADELIAKGARKFIVTGTCGVLDAAIPRGAAVLVTRALRDEGTSFHYLPPSRWIDADPAVVEAIDAELQSAGIAYERTCSWTTDAFYRETPGKVRRRREEGCRVVEMEASALFALGRFRHVPVGALLMASDDVTGQSWNRRHDHVSILSPEQILDLAIAACLRL